MQSKTKMLRLVKFRSKRCVLYNNNDVVKVKNVVNFFFYCRNSKGILYSFIRLKKKKIFLQTALFWRKKYKFVKSFFKFVNLFFLCQFNYRKKIIKYLCFFIFNYFSFVFYNFWKLRLFYLFKESFVILQAFNFKCNKFQLFFKKFINVVNISSTVCMTVINNKFKNKLRKINIFFFKDKKNNYFFAKKNNLFLSLNSKYNFNFLNVRYLKIVRILVSFVYLERGWKKKYFFLQNVKKKKNFF